MEDLRQYAVFAQTAVAGSMSGAAKRLGMTPSAVSQTIRALEARTGIVLVHRSTRKLSLTEAGGRCLPHCLRLLEAATAAAASLEHARDAPTGELRVAAPIGFGSHLSPALAPVLEDWPSLKLRLIVDDRLIDLIDARVDIALRVGTLPDTSWIGRKLCDFDQILCGSSAYLKRRGMPHTLSDLLQHDWLMMTGAGAGDPLTMPGADQQPDGLTLELIGATGRHERFQVPVRTSTTSQIALQQLCEEGMGIAILFYPDARVALETGELVRLMSGWQLPSHPLTMLTPKSVGEAAKVRVAGAALKSYFAGLQRAG